MTTRIVFYLKTFLLLNNRKQRNIEYVFETCLRLLRRQLLYNRCNSLESSMRFWDID